MTKGGEKNNGRCVCRDWLSCLKTWALSQWHNYGCQNSSSYSLTVKLSAPKKMEEITHSHSLWEETVIAVNV